MSFLIESLIGLRAQIVQRRVSPAPVVEGLDVEEQVRPGLVTGMIQSMMYQFALERAKETFHGRIVVPGTHTIHAGLDAMILQQSLVGTVRVLATL